MENLTNQILRLENGKHYLVLRQAAYKGNTYFLAAEVTEDEEEFTNEFQFFTKVPKDNGEFVIKKVTDPEVLEVLSKNIKLD